MASHIGISVSRSKVVGWLAPVGGALTIGATLSAQPAVRPAPTKTPTLYAVEYAHLDTEWLWEYPQSINEHLPATLRDNFELFAKYPHYVFNFSGANRYRLIKEYYPADYARLKRQVAAGRWFPGGSSMEEGDVNLPSPEAIIRQILYGNDFFRREFGVSAIDYLLPDCFGFPWSLPTILAHAGIKGFSTAKLTWGSSVPDQPTTPYGLAGKGIPFNLGLWVGPDGRSVVAALNPGDYVHHVAYDLSRADAQDSAVGSSPPRPWLARLEDNRRALGVFADYLYVGTGDIGGAPNEGTVAWIEKAVANANGAIRVVSAPSDQLFRDLAPSVAAKLPRYSGEMELTNHSAGSLTSQAYHKHWMRRNEMLADAAERASFGAEVLGSRRYPGDRLRSAWTLMLAGHFHDIAAGTATPKAYQYAWNDAIIAMNQLTTVMSDASESIAASLDTRGRGTPLVVYNSLEIDREDIVEAELAFSGGRPEQVTVMGPDGRSVPAQLEALPNGRSKVVFLARVPSMGYAVYDVRPEAGRVPSALKVGDRLLENERYRVMLDERGDVASIRDKRIDQELLAAPIRLAIKADTPQEFPAWNMDWSDEIKPPRSYVGGKPTISVSEQGPARIALAVERVLDSSRFRQEIRLAAGDAGNRVEFQTTIDWREPNATLKALFPLTASNDSATYNWGVGTIVRGNANERKFEVPSHQWIDLTDRSGAFGVTVLTGDKHGSDKPDASTLGLTLVRTPGLSERGRDYSHQATQDWGHHEILYGLSSHTGDRRAARTDWQALRLDVPLFVFESPKHAGRLGKLHSLFHLSSRAVRVMALKKAERTDEYVIRLTELDGRPANRVQVSFPTRVTSAREVDGQEQPVGRASILRGALTASLGPFQVRSFAIRLAPDAPHPAVPISRPVRLDYDVAVASNDGTRTVGGFDGSGRALPAELLPSRIQFGGITFALPPAATGTNNAVTARGQAIRLPAGTFDRVYVLAASSEADQIARFQAGNRPVDLRIQSWGGYVGQWDTRVWKRVVPNAEETARRRAIRTQVDSQFRAELIEARSVGGDTMMALRTIERSKRLFERFLDSWDDVYAGLEPGFIKRAPIAWFASHRHTATGENDAYAYSYLFAYEIDLEPGARTLVLPDNPAVRILAVTLAAAGPKLTPAAPLHDTQ